MAKLHDRVCAVSLRTSDLASLFKHLALMKHVGETVWHAFRPQPCYDLSWGDSKGLISPISMHGAQFASSRNRTIDWGKKIEHFFDFRGMGENGNPQNERKFPQTSANLKSVSFDFWGRTLFGFSPDCLQFMYFGCPETWLQVCRSLDVPPPVLFDLHGWGSCIGAEAHGCGGHSGCWCRLTSIMDMLQI